VALHSPHGKREALLVLFRNRRVVAKIFKPCLYWAGQFDRQRLTFAVDSLARLHADPPFVDRIFLDIGAHAVLKPDANAALQSFRIEMRAARIDREMFGRGVVFCFFAHRTAL